MGQIRSIHIPKCHIFAGDCDSLDDCRDANFIYGPNGSGKSTISNLFRDKNMIDDPSVVEWEGPSSEVVVYNRAWKEENFSDCDELPGVFTLGSASIEDLNKVKQLEDQCKKTNVKIESLETVLGNVEAEIISERKNFEELAWKQIYKPNDVVLGQALSPDKTKSKFAVRIVQAADSPLTKTRVELETLVPGIFGKQQELCPQINIDQFASYFETIEMVEASSLWRTVISGSGNLPISELINNLMNSDWVNQGRKFLGEGKICPFCQQEIKDPSFFSQIESFFDEKFESSVNELSSLLLKYSQAGDALKNIFEAILSNEDITNCGRINTDEFKAKWSQFALALETNCRGMKEKDAEPSKIASVKSTAALRDGIHELIYDAVNNIKLFNDAIENRQTEKNRVSCEVWALLAAENLALLDSYKKKMKGLNKKLSGIKNRLETLHGVLEKQRGQLIESRKGITNVRTAVDNINRSLKTYGFTNFSLAESREKENYYQVVRGDGSLASNTLSEGEETFIAFLYFVEIVHGSVSENSIRREKVIVVDDPICSLDSTILYIVSALMKQFICEARDKAGDIVQVFLLTHNVYFHKEASYFRGQAFSDGKTRYWTIHKTEGDSFIRPHEEKNPIKTSYELLWEELRNDCLDSTITLQNTMRRIIESYFSMLGSKRTQRIEEEFETVEEQVICQSFFHWSNDGSHAIPDDLYIDSYSSSPAKYKEVFKKIFEVTNNIEHYNMMMGISSLQTPKVEVAS